MSLLGCQQVAVAGSAAGALQNVSREVASRLIIRWGCRQGLHHGRGRAQHVPSRLIRMWGRGSSRVQVARVAWSLVMDALDKRRDNSRSVWNGGQHATYQLAPANAQLRSLDDASRCMCTGTDKELWAAPGWWAVSATRHCSVFLVSLPGFPIAKHELSAQNAVYRWSGVNRWFAVRWLPSPCRELDAVPPLARLLSASDVQAQVGGC